MWIRDSRHEELVALSAALEAVKDARTAAVTALRQEIDELRGENKLLRNRLAAIGWMAAHFENTDDETKGTEE